MRTSAIVMVVGAIAGPAYAAGPDSTPATPPVSANTAPNLPSTIPALNPPAAAPPACTGAQDFFMTKCTLSYYGVQLYGTIDVGVDYMTHGTPLNNRFVTGLEYLVQKNSNRSLFSFAPNGLSQSNVGLKGVEPLAYGVNLVFDGEFGFDPYSYHLADGPGSLVQNNGVALANQSSNGDSSRAGQAYNSLLYAGLSSSRFGTLIAGRVNTITLDGIIAYDPQGGSYAFSPIGYSGVAAGVGDTETARSTTAVKYHVDIDNIRLGALAQVGSYAQGNASTSGYELQVGGDFDIGPGKLSVDGIFSEFDDAVSAAPLSAAQNLKYPSTLAATLSNDQSEMLLAKYGVGKARLFAGYEHIIYANPSRTNAEFRGIGGYQFDAPNINVKAYSIHRDLQIFWVGLKYFLTPKLQLTGAYYQYIQNSFNKKNCFDNSAASCAGELHAASLVVDWQVMPKLDAYAGIMLSSVDNGLANGYLHRVNADPGVGVRFRF